MVIRSYKTQYWLVRRVERSYTLGKLSTTTDGIREKSSDLGSRYICNIGYGGKEITLTNNVLILTANTIRRPPLQSQTASLQKCLKVIGTWMWFTAQLVTLNNMEQITDQKGVLIENWSCYNQQTDAVQLIWNNGYTDIMTLTADNRRLERKNNLWLQNEQK